MDKRKGTESGEVMLEGMIVMIITTLMLVWILAVGFLYYQKYTVRILSNDVCKKIAATYDAPETDLITGYIGVNDLSKRNLYVTPSLRAPNEARANSYVKYILDKTNFSGVVDSESIQVSLTPERDALGRSHLKIETECTFHTPFGIGLELFTLSKDTTYRVTSYAESTNLTDYISSVMLADALTNGTFLKGTGFVEKTVNMINSFINLYDQYSDNGESDGAGGSSGGGFSGGSGDGSGGGGGSGF